MDATEWVERYGVSGMVLGGPDSARDADGWEHNAMTIQLTYYRPGTGSAYRVDVPWRMGLGLDVGEFTGTGDRLPVKSVAEVVGSLGADMRYGQMPYPEFADELGMWDEKGYRAWEACQALSKQLTDWCYSQAMVDDLADVEFG